MAKQPWCTALNYFAACRRQADDETAFVLWVQFAGDIPLALQTTEQCADGITGHCQMVTEFRRVQSFSPLVLDGPQPQQYEQFRPGTACWPEVLFCASHQQGMGEPQLASNTNRTQIYLWIVAHEALKYFSIAKGRTKFADVASDALFNRDVFGGSAVFVRHCLLFLPLYAAPGQPQGSTPPRR